MTLWIDAQLSPALAPWLVGRFSVTAVHIRDIARVEATDREIFSAAGAANAVIITKDRDFVELVRRRGSPPSIVWISCGNTSNPALFQILELTFANACRLLEAGETVVQIKG